MIVEALLRQDLIVFDELGYLPFSQSGAQLLFQLISQLYENTSIIITTNLAFADWPCSIRSPIIARSSRPATKAGASRIAPDRRSAPVSPTSKPPRLRNPDQLRRGGAIESAIAGGGCTSTRKRGRLSMRFDTRRIAALTRMDFPAGFRHPLGGAQFCRP